MKKRKTYEISVIDKTYSKTISDETKFYTSDTSLELVFKLKETEFDFESAEIVLLNVDDRSLVTRVVSKTSDSFMYEIEEDITAHYGDWRGQLRFEQGGETYVSSLIKFRIENDLENDRPPQLSDVQSWTSLKRYADKLTDELKQAVDEAVTKVETMDETFNNNELERDKAEKERQSTFETNEIERQSVFETAEQERQSAELIRIENEEERVLGYENMQDNIGMIGKVKLVNLVINGDFSNGVNGWIGNVNYVTTDEYVSQPNSYLRHNSSNTFFQDIPAPSNHTLYICTYVKGLNPARLRINHFETFNVIKYSHYSKAVEWSFISEIVTTHNGGIRLDPHAGTDWGAYYDDVITIDLTSTFGAGNEPSKEVMDWVISENGYFEELYISRDDIQQYEINQLKKAVLALGGTI